MLTSFMPCTDVQAKLRITIRKSNFHTSAAGQIIVSFTFHTEDILGYILANQNLVFQKLFFSKIKFRYIIRFGDKLGGLNWRMRRRRSQM